ncbi:hypothetical protein BCR41DRAFT_344441 [Lobosporangium transversale]|uniref:F-box domain-containing protein n=1 Tax=Lobosporangium transversale TaxID=64571 RepID=A0A1Y2H384_9FUNG|nr:hypothetical protein BCR41DRAFT_344441 [Lobosporangium transversale]ORZ29019.1 hypothetical protein BCR41DRAFT_344441 [Lobosporangium transversale]|eukprot:XP_021886692.1 hypothetical protein BCR41DRAFT_344441 [Lobosporangium transversale]
MLPALPPEVIERILSFVGQASLRTNIPLVSHQWYRMARVLLKRTVHFSAIHLKEGVNEQVMAKKLGLAYTLACQRGSYPKFYTARLPLGQEEASWSILRNALASLASSSATSFYSFGLKIRQFFFSADLNTDVWSQLLPLLRILGPGLTCLHLDSVPYSAKISMAETRRLCPNLEELSVATVAASYAPWRVDSIAKLEEEQDLDIKQDDSTDHLADVRAHIKQKRPWPLRSATFEKLGLTETALESFLRSCPELTELRIVNAQPVSERGSNDGPMKNFLLTKERRTAFFGRLSSYCPKLDSLHVSVCEPSSIHEEAAPIAQFPLVEHWGVSTASMVRHPLSSACVLLDAHRMVNRLTTVEIIGPCRGSTAADERRIGVWVHQLLCESPLLEHFKALEVNLPLDLLYVTKALFGQPCVSQSFLSPLVPLNQRVWACRKLKTLHIRIDEQHRVGMTDFAEQLRVVLGYISRVCPDLEKLAINRTNVFIRGPVSLCLLSRLKRLRTLQLYLRGYPLPLKENSIDWMKRQYYYDTQEQMKQQWEKVHKRQFSAVKGLLRLWKAVRTINDLYCKDDSVSLSEQSLGVSFPLVRSRFDGSIFNKNKEIKLPDIATDQKHGQRTYEKKNEKELSEHGREIIDGVDMTHLGQVQDLINYFQGRRAHREECLWPEMETIDMRFQTNENRHAQKHYALKEIQRVINKIRPEIEIIMPPLQEKAWR